MLDHPLHPRKRRRFQSSQWRTAETFLSLFLPSQCLVVHPFRYEELKMFLSLVGSGTRGHFFPVMRRSATSGTSTSSSSYPVKPRLLATCSTWHFGSSLLLLDYFAASSHSGQTLYLSASQWGDPTTNGFHCIPLDVLVVVGMQSYTFSRKGGTVWAKYKRNIDLHKSNQSENLRTKLIFYIFCIDNDSVF